MNKNITNLVLLVGVIITGFILLNKEKISLELESRGITAFAEHNREQKCLRECRQNYTTTCQYQKRIPVYAVALDGKELVKIPGYPVYEISSEDHPGDIWMVVRVNRDSFHDWAVYPKGGDPTNYILFRCERCGMDNFTSSRIWIDHPHDSCYRYCNIKN